MAYKITRLPKEYLGTFDKFASVEYILNEEGKPANNINKWPPRVGDGVVVRGNIAMCDNCPTNWITTEIEEIHELKDGTCKFRTKNSEYEIIKTD